MAKKKAVAGKTVSGMSVADAVEKATKQLQGELDNARTVGADLMRKNDEQQLELVQLRQQGRELTDALLWCSALPDVQLGGQHHDSFKATVYPVLAKYDVRTAAQREGRLGSLNLAPALTPG